MTETQEATALTVEQQQRLAAVGQAARFLRDGGSAVIGGNNSKAGHVVDIIDLAHYIVTGIPFGVDHAHEHLQSMPFPGQIAEIKVEPGTLQADALGGIFQQTFGFNPFVQEDGHSCPDCESEDAQSEDVPAPAFDSDDKGDERNCD